MQADSIKKWISPGGMRREYAADLGDLKRTRRAEEVGVALAKKPELSLPEVFADEADLEAAYRFIRNPLCVWRDLLSAHIERTLGRAGRQEVVLVAHDTTDVSFTRYWPETMRRNMASLSSRTQGFLLHASIAVTGAGQALPLGVVDVQPFVHQSGLDPEDTESLEFWDKEFGLFDNEHERWFRAVAAADDAMCAHGVQPIHVMDRETDSYGLLSWMQRHGFRFVVRGNTHRALKAKDGLRKMGVVDVELGERFALRDGKKVNTHPTRRARAARLAVRAGEVTLKRTSKAQDASWAPGGFDSQPKRLTLNLVEAIEEHPPTGETGVRSLLLTTEPIDTTDDALVIIEWYRRRWLIEEYFKSLKTGCRLEERQMESMDNMLRVIALLLPAAWRLLLLRAVADEAPESKWTHLLTRLEFRMLTRAVPKAKLTSEANVAQCVATIAKLGGHLPRNGPPGWQTLHAGWRRLQDLVVGARLARGEAINP